MKFKKLYCLSIVYFIVFSIHNINAQNSDKKNIKKHYFENFLINSDRDLFVAGETIYFKIYGSSNNINNNLLSKILYVELIELNNNLSVFKAKFKILKNTISGNIQIPENINSGMYAIRVYTQWNRNFNHTEKFDKYIAIINPKTVSSFRFIPHKNTVKIIPSNTVENNVIIFIPRNIRAKNSFHILKNDSITDNIEVQNGFYEFKRNPTDAAKYSILQVSTQGDSVSYPFPEIKRNKPKIKVFKENNTIKYQISNVKFLNDKHLILKIYSNNNEILYSKLIYLNNKLTEQYLQSNILKSGINYCVLTNEKDDIINISCIYNRIKINKKIIINTGKKVFNTRELVNMEIKYTGNEDLNADISVILKGTEQFDYGFNPEYLFQNKNLLTEYLAVNKDISDKETEQILSLYENYLNENKVNFFPDNTFVKRTDLFIPDIRGVSLKGYVKDKKTLQNLSNIRVILSSFKSNPQIHFTYTDENGRFIFSLNNFYGKTDLFICTDAPEKHKIFISNPFEDYAPENKNYTVFFNTQSKPVLKDLYQNAQIHGSFSQKETIKEKKSVYNIQADFKKYNLNNYIQFKSLKEAVFEIMPEVHLKMNNDDTYSFVIFDSDGNKLPGHPLVLFDDIPVYDISKIINADFLTIKHFNVLNRPYLLGKNIINGIISIHTNNKDLSSIDLSDSGYFLKYEGLQIPSEEDFLYKYNKITPDFRNTLFWKPKILINKNVKKISFRTSDNTGIYKIIVKGIDTGNNYIYSSEYIRIE